MFAAPSTTLLAHFTSWNDMSGQPAPVTFSFATDIPAGSVAFSAPQQASSRLALAAWDSVSGLSFVEVPDMAGGAGIDLRFRLDPMSAINVLGQSSLPPWGDVALNVALFRGDSLAPSATRIGFQTLLHEIGHGLGLSHPAPGTANAAANTLMIDTLGRGAPARAPLPWDREAVQTLYGTPEAEAALGLRWSWDGALAAVRGQGTTGDDLLTGTANRDALFGAAGRDLLQGGQGDDLLAPGAGDDVVDGGAGWDVLRLDTSRSALRLDPAGQADSADGRDRFTGIEVIEMLDGSIQLTRGGVVGGLVGLYKAAFGRAPDAGGLAFWASTWKLDPDITHVAANFLRSAEFRDGPGLAARFAALGEMQPAGDEAAALAWLAGRADIHARFTDGIWVADADALLVARMYDLALGRVPDEVGFRFWLGHVQDGFSAEGLAQGFHDSPEAVARGGSGFLDSAALLAAAQHERWAHYADGVVFA